MIVVSDTSPIHYLILIDRIHLLPDLFGTVVIPPAVAQELSHAAAPAQVREWIGRRPAWLEVRTPTVTAPKLPRLGAGETQAISLVHELHADLLVTDDLDARRAAAANGINVTGTLGVVIIASQRGLIDLADTVRRLQATTLRLPEELLDELLGPDSKD